MDTNEARTQMCDIANDALEIVERLQETASPSPEDRSRLRQMLTDARALLSDAGYPGEAVWRGLQRGSIGAETHLDQSDSSYWRDVAQELKEGIQTLESLIATRRSREADFRVVG